MASVVPGFKGSSSRYLGETAPCWPAVLVVAVARAVTELFRDYEDANPTRKRPLNPSWHRAGP